MLEIKKDKVGTYSADKYRDGHWYRSTGNLGIFTFSDGSRTVYGEYVNLDDEEDVQYFN